MAPLPFVAEGTEKILKKELNRVPLKSIPVQSINHMVQDIQMTRKKNLSDNKYVKDFTSAQMRK